jgi:hypothetical protein
MKLKKVVIADGEDSSEIRTEDGRVLTQINRDDDSHEAAVKVLKGLQLEVVYEDGSPVE